MKRKSIQAVITFLAAGTILSFFCVLIFTLKVSKGSDQLVKQLSTLTEYIVSHIKSQNAMQWAASPGEYGIPVIHSFQLFNYTGPIEFIPQFDLLNTTYNYTYKYEYKNRTYIPSSPGYVKFLPFTEYVANFNESLVQDNITQINLVSVQQFYRQLQAPLMKKLPTYLNIILNTLKNDFLLTYFTNAIHSFYVEDEQLTKQTILAYIEITDDQKNALWQDETFGWSSRLTFKPWIRYALMEPEQYDGIYSQLVEQFNLTSTQMIQLVGPTSTIVKMIRMILSSVSDGIMDDLQGNCHLQICTLRELASIQWGRGSLTSTKLFPGDLYPGGYGAMNESIDDTFEFYQDDEQKSLSIDQCSQLTNVDVELETSLLSFQTQNLIQRYLNSPQRILLKLQLQSNDTVTSITTYLEKLTTWVNAGFPLQLAQETWKIMAQLVDQGSSLLRNGLHAKALFYKQLKCSDILAGDDDLIRMVCGDSSLDFTLSASNGMIWVEAILLQNQINKNSFQVLKSNSINNIFQKDQLRTTDTILSELLWAKTSKLNQIVSEIAASISTSYKCKKVEKCKAQELFLVQWFDCGVTLNLPQNLQFKDSDRVCGLGKWDVVNQPTKYFEFGAYLAIEGIKSDLKLNPSQINQILDYDMGGILGYYSIYNLTKAVYNKNITQLNSAFPLNLEQATLMVNYLKQVLVESSYGGQLINTNILEYLWQYDNDFTRSLATISPLEGGADWKSNAANLFQKNNKQFTDTASSDDLYVLNTGLNDITKARQMVKILGDTQIKNKEIIYKNLYSNYTQNFYRYPYDDNKVRGSEGLGFIPNEANLPQELVEFDWNIHDTQTLKKVDSGVYFDMQSITYRYGELHLNLSKMESYPIYISANGVVKNCIGNINGMDCQAFQKAQLDQEANEVIVEMVSGFVVSKQRTYTYWLNLEECAELFGDDSITTNMIPLAIKIVNFTYSSDNVIEVLGEVQDLRLERTLYWIVFFVLAGCFSLALLLTTIYYCKNKENYVDDDYDHIQVYSQLDVKFE